MKIRDRIADAFVMAYALLLPLGLIGGLLYVLFGPSVKPPPAPPTTPLRAASPACIATHLQSPAELDSELVAYSDSVLLDRHATKADRLLALSILQDSAVRATVRSERAATDSMVARALCEVLPSDS